MIDWTGIGTAATGVAALVAALTGLYNGRRITANSSKIDDVHTAVNNTAQKQNRRVDQLTDALTATGQDVPPRDPPVGDEEPAGGAHVVE